MRSIGIRVKPSEVIFAIIDNLENKVLLVSKIKLQKALTYPQQLSYIRSTLLDILNEYEIEKAGIRIAENIAFQKDTTRIQIEGVIQEMFASSSLKDYYVGRINTISSKIKIEQINFKKYVNNELEYKEIENWAKHSIEEREALLTALGAFNV